MPAVEIIYYFTFLGTSLILEGASGEGHANAGAAMNGFVLNSDIQLLVLANSGRMQQFE